MRILVIPFLVFLSLSSFGQDTLRTYIFGHSLIHHENRVNPVPTEETSVPYWMHFLTKEAGNRFEVSGRYGFIPQHARGDIWSQWSFDSVPSAWNSFISPFSSVGFDNILITPANFIQWQKPSADYWNETRSVIDFTSDVFDSVLVRESAMDFYIYENWPDLGPRAAAFPPTPKEWETYNDYLNGHFHDWFLEYHDSMVLRHPNHFVKMIPVGPVISKVLSTAPFNKIPIDSLYEDDAPHGRPSVYFLAALTTYMAINHEKAPLGYRPPNFINGYYMVDKAIIDNYATVVDLIWKELKAFNFRNGDSRVFISKILTEVEEMTTEPKWTVYPNPSNNWVKVESAIDVECIQLYSSKGELVIAGKQRQLDVTRVLPGLYVLEAKFVNGSAFRRKLMVE